MKVVFKEPKNKSLIKIHNDLMVETCKSFGVNIAETPQGNTVILSEEGEFELCDYPDLEGIDCVIVGCDDDFESDNTQGFDSVRIETPVDYFLWSGVALGIFLYEYRKSQRHNKSNSGG